MLPCSGMSVFKTLRGLQQLDLTDTMVADPGMQHITRLKDLKTLSLAYSSESSALPADSQLQQTPCRLSAVQFSVASQIGHGHTDCRLAHGCLPGSLEAAAAVRSAHTWIPVSSSVFRFARMFTSSVPLPDGKAVTNPLLQSWLISRCLLTDHTVPVVQRHAASACSGDLGPSVLRSCKFD